jgi:3-hydroxyisobutyrate dehydrogenase
VKIGFIGLGTMGQGMASNLAKAGLDLVLHDVDAGRAVDLVAGGATWVASVAELGALSDVVFTSLPGPKEMEAVGVGQGGLLGSMRPGSVWFDLTTNSPPVVQRLAALFEARGIALLDAPVSGGAAGARSGRLALYVGGPRDLFDTHKPLLDAIGDRVLHVGPVGSGNTAKLAHNCCSMTVRMAIAEVFTLGVKAGMDPLELWNAVRQGVLGRNRTFDGIGAEYLQSKYDPPNFTLRLAHKDFTLALDLARELGVPMKQAETAYADYTEALERGWGERDSRVAMHVQNLRAGVEIKASAQDVAATLERG